MKAKKPTQRQLRVVKRDEEINAAINRVFELSGFERRHEPGFGYVTYGGLRGESARLVMNLIKLTRTVARTGKIPSPSDITLKKTR